MLWFLEGTIGAGKSSVLARLSDYPNVVVLPEPVDMWTNHLERVYTGDAAFALPMQMLALTMRMEAVMGVLKDAITNQDTTYIVERGPRGSRAFASLMDPMDQGVYQRVYDSYVGIVPRACRTLYLRVDPSCAEHRVRVRDRPCERSLTLDRLSAIHDAHEAAFARAFDTTVVDGTRALGDVVQSCAETMRLQSVQA